MQKTSQKDFLWLQLRDMPYFRGLLRAVESRFYQDIELTEPILDLGCGDGHFVTVAFDHPIDVGIDPWTSPVREAAQRGGYELVSIGYGDKLPFPDEYFGSGMSNSVLEHIPELDPVMAEMQRVLKPGALFVFCVPNHNFLANLSVSNFFDKIGLRSLGKAYRSFFNRISRHHNCDDPQTWQERLEKAGFKLERWWHYFSPGALGALEWGHYFGLPSLLARKLFGRWVLVRRRWNLALVMHAIEKYYQEADEQPKGSYTFYIARRI
jgi:SAM-dependent methyltransferase